MLEKLMPIIIPIVVIYPAYALIRIVFSWFPYRGWGKNAKPDMQAAVCNVKIKKVFMLPKFRTTVYFSDGYWYCSHKTNVERDMSSFFSTRQRIVASVDGDTVEYIRYLAQIKHAKAARKKLKLPKYDSATPMDAAQQNKWICSCGRSHAHNVSSCVCGVTKRSIMTQQNKNNT